jgi:hypothetical protein
LGTGRGEKKERNGEKVCSFFFFSTKKKKEQKRKEHLIGLWLSNKTFNFVLLFINKEKQDRMGWFYKMGRKEVVKSI